MAAPATEARTMTENYFIPYGAQWITDDDVAALSEAATAAFLTTGPTVDKFERALSRVVGCDYSVAVNSGTAALHAAYAALGLGPGDEIITSPLTFAATANAAVYLGADVRFVDVEPDTGNLDPNLVREAITERTRLVVAVDYAGHPAEYDALRDVSESHGIPLIADAAHSIGATYRGARVGTLADATTFSFHPVKAMTTGEGGAVVTARKDIADAASRFRNHGIVRAPEELSRDEGPWYYEIASMGYNYRLSDLQCALGLRQLRRLEAFIARRRAIASALSEGLREVPGITLPVERPHVESAWHLFPVRVVDVSRRRAFFERLRELGLGVQVHYAPVYWHPFYSERGHGQTSCPVVEDFYRRAVSLPIFPRMSDADVAQVVARVRRAAAEVLGS